MSTNSTIGRYNKKTKKFEHLYVHFDGFLDHVGKILINNFTSSYNIEKIFQGNIKSFDIVVDKDNVEKIVIDFFENDNGKEKIIQIDELKQMKQSFKEYYYLNIKKQWFFSFNPIAGWALLTKDNLENLKIVMYETPTLSKISTQPYNEKEEMKFRIKECEKFNIKLYDNDILEKYSETYIKDFNDFLIHLEQEKYGRLKKNQELNLIF